MIRNTHERRLAAPAPEVWDLVRALGSPGDRLWPSGWPPVRFDGPLAVGARGGHGPIHYEVLEDDRSVGLVLGFRPPTSVDGFHAFRIEPDGDHACVLRHEVLGRPYGWMRLVWPLALRPLHDTVVEELLDRAELATGTAPAQPWRRPASVRLLRAGSRPRRRPRAREESGRLRVVEPVPAQLSPTLTATLPRVDWADAFAVDLPLGSPSDADHWREAVFGADVGGGALLRLRDRLVGLVGLRPACPDDSSPGAFAVLSSSPDETVLGMDDRHLALRVSVLVQPSAGGRAPRLVLTTAVQLENRWGARYLRVVEPFHRLLVPRIMRRAVERERGAYPRAMVRTVAAQVGR